MFAREEASDRYRIVLQVTELRLCSIRIVGRLVEGNDDTVV